MASTKVLCREAWRSLLNKTISDRKLTGWIILSSNKLIRIHRLLWENDLFFAERDNLRRMSFEECITKGWLWLYLRKGYELKYNNCPLALDGFIQSYWSYFGSLRILVEKISYILSSRARLEVYNINGVQLCKNNFF